MKLICLESVNNFFVIVINKYGVYTWYLLYVLFYISSLIWKKLLYKSKNDFCRGKNE